MAQPGENNNQKMKESIRIDTYIDCDDSPVWRKVLSIRREVWKDGKLIAKMEMDPKTYYRSEDPVRRMEKALLGLEKRKGSDNAVADTTDKIGFFKHIWFKLFGKKV